MYTFSLSHSDADQRLDKFLRKLLPEAPLSAIYRMNRIGKVKVNGKKQKDNSILRADDTVTLFLDENAWQEYSRQKTEVRSSRLTISIGSLILYEDDDLIILNKPRGINVHPGDHKQDEPSLIELVHDHLGNRYNTLTFRPSLVHRIDRDTSGVLMIAKTKRCLDAMLSLLHEKKIEKIYHAIAIGTPEPKRGTIEKKLLRIEEARHEAKVQVDETNGQTAITHYRTLREYGKYSLLECRLETGRTHQIRVHLSAIGHPILGDTAYGNPHENAFLRRTIGLSRQMLHAFSLSFRHPITEKILTITAPYPEDFQGCLEGLGAGGRQRE